MIAASDTTAGLVSPMMSCITERKNVYSKLMLEISDFDSSGRLSRPVALYDETNIMPYFKACVNETLRLFPPTPIILPRMVCKGGLNLGDIYLPEGTEIGANPWLTNRNQDIFGEDADAFRPERWLESAETSKEMEKYTFTFGYGGRACIGKNLAQFEAQKLCLQVSDCPRSIVHNQADYCGLPSSSEISIFGRLNQQNPGDPMTGESASTKISG